MNNHEAEEQRADALASKSRMIHERVTILANFSFASLQRKGNLMKELTLLNTELLPAYHLSNKANSLPSPIETRYRTQLTTITKLKLTPTCKELLTSLRANYRKGSTELRTQLYDLQIPMILEQWMEQRTTM